MDSMSEKNSAPLYERLWEDQLDISKVQWNGIQLEKMMETRLVCCLACGSEFVMDLMMQ